MKLSAMNWLQVEEYLQHDDRAVLPLGSTEQHGYLSLSVDSILSEKIALDAAEASGVPVFPVVAYGLTPYFRAYPGTISLRVGTYVQVVRDILDGLAESGFRRILIVNGHGGNAPAQSLVNEWIADRSGVRVKFHNWWNAPRTWEHVQRIDPEASHASWMENFPWTRLPGVDVPDLAKPMVDMALLRQLTPQEARDRLGEGNFGGRFQRSDEEMEALWSTAVAETRALLEDGWAGL